MQILKIEDGKKEKAVEVHAIMGMPEFEQLLGALDNLCVFSTKTIAEKSSVIRTGARHSAAKYLLFPVALRRKMKADEYDFDKIRCGTVKFKDTVYVIYGVERKGAPVDQEL